jgi:hypothetical protein
VETSLLLTALALPAGASAQASGEASSDIELGANQASEIEMSAGARADADDDGASRPTLRGGDSDTRLGIQVRLDAINVLSRAEPIGADLGTRLLVPIVAPGVRLLDDGALFFGLGFGFAGTDGAEGPGEEYSRSGFSISPLATFDVLGDEAAALSLLGALNIGSLGESETCGGGGPGPGPMTCVQGDDDAFIFGLTLGAGIRGKLSEGLALGGEFGWGFLNISSDPEGDTFIHGIFGNLTLEASVGI